jgi:Uncharacterized protein conserved in bacteria (DUF2188)
VKQRGRKWIVQRVDAFNADSLHDRKEDAIARGREIAERHRGRLRIKGHDGRVEAEHDFSDAPSRRAP